MPRPPFDPHQPVARWTPWRKQILLEAYAAGTISAEAIRLIHAIAADELGEWQRRNGAGGDQGRRHLRATDLQAVMTRPVEGLPARPASGKVGKRKGHKRKVAPAPAALPTGPERGSTLYKMTIIRTSGEPKLCFEFRGPGCRRKMLNWLAMYQSNAEHGGIRGITVSGTIGNKTDTLLAWKPGQQKAASG